MRRFQALSFLNKAQRQGTPSLAFVTHYKALSGNFGASSP